MSDKKIYRCPDTDCDETSSDEEVILESIQKWRTIIEKLEAGYTIENYYSDSCALCAKYPDFDCEDCLLYKKTGKICNDLGFTTFKYGNIEHDKEKALEGAREMLEYLIDLADSEEVKIPEENYKLPDIRKEDLQGLTDNEILDKSIEKWKTVKSKLEQGLSVSNVGRLSCALCVGICDCEECPVYNKTKIVACIETPYDNLEFSCDDSVIPTPDNIKLAQDEIEFLESLKTKETTKSLLYELNIKIIDLDIRSTIKLDTIRIITDQVITSYEFEQLIKLVLEYKASIYVYANEIIIQFPTDNRDALNIGQTNQKLKFKEFLGEEIELEVVNPSESMVHNHLNIYKDGKLIGYMHLFYEKPTDKFEQRITTYFCNR